MSRKWFAFVALLFLSLLTSCLTLDRSAEEPMVVTPITTLAFPTPTDLTVSLSEAAPAPLTQASPSDSGLEGLPLLTQSALTYIGAFRLPDQDNLGNMLQYGGHAMSYNPANHSLFLGSHAWDQKLCEVGIPDTINLDQTAVIIQDCEDATEGRRAGVDDSEVFLGGTLLHKDRLVISVYSYYDADETQTLSHFSSSPDLSQQGDISGPFQVGERAGYVSGYMALIPEAWQSSLGGVALTGNCCIPIINRTSFGPALSVFNPDDLGATDPAPAAPLLYYTADNPLAAWDADSEYFNGSTRIVGVAIPPGTRSILFFGSQGIGKFCYGTGEECDDPVDDSHGTHAYPYIHQVWAYDAIDLLAVKKGQSQPWDARPYALWRLTEMNNEGGATISGAVYDPVSGRVYITENYAETPLVHVYEITYR